MNRLRKNLRWLHTIETTKTSTTVKRAHPRLAIRVLYLITTGERLDSDSSCSLGLLDTLPECIVRKIFTTAPPNRATYAKIRQINSGFMKLTQEEWYQAYLHKQPSLVSRIAHVSCVSNPDLNADESEYACVRVRKAFPEDSTLNALPVQYIGFYFANWLHDTVAFSVGEEHFERTAEICASVVRAFTQYAHYMWLNVANSPYPSGTFTVQFNDFDFSVRTLMCCCTVHVLYCICTSTS